MKLKEALKHCEGQDNFMVMRSHGMPITVEIANLILEQSEAKDWEVWELLDKGNEATFTRKDIK